MSTAQDSFPCKKISLGSYVPLGRQPPRESDGASAWQPEPSLPPWRPAPTAASPCESQSGSPLGCRTRAIVALCLGSA